ncbi:hypothetical protein E3T35_12830 [Cryobacterium sp. TMT1-2-2]|uniref:thermonuclease family protein n=1 Tax=Cryobacterium sp. TMT1-2-2 TaxID=1259233 RepID=UPI00106AB863|nr:hypothetical protein [Cryobacterium sp. TMT1-2-2]TFD10209.1 hypothetical protein E3T35_12830 [Cryobacterium sp. TMT1-2-2]
MKTAPSLSPDHLPRSARLVVAGFVAAALVVVAGVVSSAPALAAEVDQAVVVRVVDGDTLVVELKGKQTRVRLLNVDTPETKDPNEPADASARRHPRT